MASESVEWARRGARFRKMYKSVAAHFMPSELQIDLLRIHCELEPRKPIMEKPQVCKIALKEMLKYIDMLDKPSP